jgi:DNA-binding GntR family transcriptional regulator
MAESILLKRDSKISLTDQAYFELKKRILNGQMPIGEHFLEPEVAEMLGISRTPTREALLRLAQDGLVDVKPRRGVWVKPISVNDFKEIYEILTSLESSAVSLAAKQDLTDPDLLQKMENLKEIVDEMDHALADDDLDCWAEADVRFHIALVELGGNGRICSLVQN